MSEAATAQTFTEGDIFSWRYADEDRRVREHGWSYVYHCKSRIAVFENGRLHDTFWHSSSDNSEVNPTHVVLTFLGNPKDMKTILAGERVFYRDEDIVSMQHSNNSGAPVYAKGPRDPEKMRAYFAYQIERTEGEIRWAHRRIEECREAIARVERGEIDGLFYIYPERSR